MLFTRSLFKALMMLDYILDTTRLVICFVSVTETVRIQCTR